MRQKTLTTEMSFERLDREMEREVSLDRTEQTRISTEPSRVRLVKFAWVSIKLCNSLLYRMLNLCEVGVDEVFYAFRMRRFFAGMELNPVTVPQESATFHSHPLLEEDNYLRPANSQDISGRRSNFEISWRTPWLYMVLLLLIWLLLF